jgi:hypothetical protein
MVLHGLDRALHTDRTEPYTLAGSLTVEHFLPQHWETHWKLEPVEGESAEDLLLRQERRNRLLQTFGNLTLLTQSLNPAVSNGRFKKKRDEILKHSAINLNRFLYNLDSWDENGILERGGDLFNVAKKTWRYPTHTS